MHKKLLPLSALALSLSFLTACGGKEVAPQAPQFVEHCEYVTGIQAPEWYCTPEMEGGIAAIGVAKPNAARDQQMQRTMALAAGRDELARQTEVKVQNLLTDWSRATGEGDAQTYEKNFENVSRQMAQQSLQGSRQLKRWIAPNGDLVLLVGMNEEEAKNNLKTSLRNEEALWQQFQSKQALDELDKQMDAAFK